MKITVYELLGLIKDGKAPKKLKHGSTIYIYDDFEKDYVDEFKENILKREIRKTNDISYIYYLIRKLYSGEYVNITKQLNYEIEIIEEPILTDKEREYLKAVIKPFEVTSISKLDWEDDEEYISIEVESSVIDYWTIELPTFKKGTRYKGMELDRYYTIEELDLEED